MMRMRMISIKDDDDDGDDIKDGNHYDLVIRR